MLISQDLKSRNHQRTKRSGPLQTAETSTTTFSTGGSVQKLRNGPSNPNHTRESKAVVCCNGQAGFLRIPVVYLMFCSTLLNLIHLASPRSALLSGRYGASSEAAYGCGNSLKNRRDSAGQLTGQRAAVSSPPALRGLPESPRRRFIYLAVHTNARSLTRTRTRTRTQTNKQKKPAASSVKTAESFTSKSLVAHARTKTQSRNSGGSKCHRWQTDL